MTVHTALDIRPAYEPKSYAEIIAADRERKRKWLAAAQKRPVARVAAMEHQPERNEPEAPMERIWPRQHDSHMAAYYEWRTNEPLGWLKLRCRELDIAYDEIIGERRFVALVAKRKQLIREVKARFPAMSLPSIGRLFGGRDHTTILASLRGTGLYDPREVSRDTTERNSRIVALYNSGFKISEIAKRVKCANKVVSFVLRDRLPERKKLRKMADHADVIREAFDEGATYAEIAHRTEFDPSAISKFIKRMGWKR